MDITTKTAALTLSNPLMPASGPLTGDDERMLLLAAQGLGALVTKTIAPVGAQVSRPCIAAAQNKLFNCELWSEYSGDTWIETFLPNVRKQTDIPVIASVGYDGNDLKQMVPRMDALVAGYEFIPRYLAQDFSEVGRVTALLRGMTRKPIWVKMCGNIGDPVGFSRVCLDSGADGVVAMASQGPNMIIDAARRRPLIGTPDGYAWTSGASIKPIALAAVHMIKQALPKASVIASGGVASAEDVIEYLLAGADAVQMLGEAMLKGRDLYGKVIADLPVLLKKYGFASVEDVKASGLLPAPSYREPSFPVIDAEACTGCGACERSCAYLGIRLVDGTPQVDKNRCFGCGLCQTRCPAKAISNVII